MTKILLIHPGHTFSTADVYDGLKAGFEANGVEVVEFRWGHIIQTMGALVGSGVATGALSRENGPRMQQWAMWVAAADALGAALEREVDAAFVVNGTLFPPDRAHRIQRLGIPVACYGTEAPYFLHEESQLAGAYTHWFTQERRCVAHFDTYTKATYLPMAYNPRTHQPMPTDDAYSCDVAFVGGGFRERKALINGADWNGIDLRTLGTLWTVDLDPAIIEQLDEIEKAKYYSDGAIDNTETAKWHRNAAISLNIHRRMTRIETLQEIDDATAESVGPRAYEIPAVGGFQLCDDARPELFDIYGESAATYRAGDSADLSRQVRYWLSHPDARDRVRAMQHEAVQPHSWTARARTVLETLF